MARPKKGTEEQRSRVVQFRLTEAEELHVRMNAAVAGITVAEYGRRRVLGMTVTPPAAKADAALISEVNRIGVNVNQLALAFNADREFKGEWRLISEQVMQVLDKVAQRYGS